MNHFNRAIKSLYRNYNRSIALIIISLTVIVVLLVSLIIKNAYQENINSIKKSLHLTAMVASDIKNQEQFLSENNVEDLPIIPPSTLKKIGQLNDVELYNLILYDGITSNNIKSIKSAADTELTDEQWTNSFSLKGVDKKSIFDFAIDRVKLIDGNFFSENDFNSGKGSVIISSEIAKKNNLSVGDMILNEEPLSEDNESLKTPLIVIGIFETNVNSKPQNDIQFEENINGSNILNTFYTTNNFILNYRDQRIKLLNQIYPTENFQNSAEFYDLLLKLKNDTNPENFRSDSSNILNSKLYKIILSYDQILTMNENLKQFEQFIQYIYIGSIAFAITAITTTLLLFLKSRKREIAIYLSLGEKKMNIIFQMITEILISFAVSCLISIILLPVIINISSIALNNLPDNSNEYDIEYETSKFYALGNQVDNIQNDSQNLQTNIGAKKITSIYILVYSILIFSTIFPLYFQTRVNPKKLLTDAL